MKILPSSERLLVPAAEAAEMLSIGRSTFWREVKEGTLPAPVKIGGATRWRVAELHSFVAGLQSGGPATNVEQPDRPAKVWP